MALGVYVNHPLLLVEPAEASSLFPDHSKAGLVDTTRRLASSRHCVAHALELVLDAKAARFLAGDVRTLPS